MIQDETDELKMIIKNILGIDVMENRRKRELVDARRIYSKILHDRHYTFEVIGGSLKKNHTTIVHYMKDIDAFFNQDNTLFTQYIICRDAFTEGKEILDKNTKRKKIYSSYKELKDKIAEFVLERKNVLILKTKYQRLDRIIELIDSKLEPGNEYFLENKLNSILNSK